MPLPSPDFWYGVLVTAVFAALAYVFGARRRRLILTYDVTKLIPKGGEKLTIMWDGREVPHPFLIRAVLEAGSAGDITPAHFEGGGVALETGDAVAVGVLSADDSLRCLVSEHGVSVEPFLLKRSQSVWVTFLASGQNPTVTSGQSRLSDASLKVQSIDARWIGSRLRIGAVLATAAAVGLVLCIIAPDALPGWIPFNLAMGIVFGLVVGVGAAMVGTSLWESRGNRVRAPRAAQQA